MTNHLTSMDANRVVPMWYNDPSRIQFKGHYRPDDMKIVGPMPCYKNELSIGNLMVNRRTSMEENRVVLMG